MTPETDRIDARIEELQEKIDTIAVMHRDDAWQFYNRLMQNIDAAWFECVSKHWSVQSQNDAMILMSQRTLEIFSGCVVIMSRSGITRSFPSGGSLRDTRIRGMAVLIDDTLADGEARVLSRPRG